MRCEVDATLPAALPLGRRPGTQLCRRLGEPPVPVRKISPIPGFDPRTVYRVAQSLYRLSYAEWYSGMSI